MGNRNRAEARRRLISPRAGLTRQNRKMSLCEHRTKLCIYCTAARGLAGLNSLGWSGHRVGERLQGQRAGLSAEQRPNMSR